jgi:hypothetical protein
MLPSLHVVPSPSVESDDSLLTVLHRHASTRDRSAISLQILDGTITASIATVAHSRPWIFVAIAGACVALHGVWSLADLHVTDIDALTPRWPRMAWRAVRGLSALGGIAALFALLLCVFGLTFGTWIS